jgi:hypothetical protein
MKSYGAVEVYRHHSYHRLQIETSSQLDAPAVLPQRKDPPVPIG